MKKLLIILSLIALAAGLACGVYHHQQTCEVCLSFDSINAETVRHYIQSFGSWGIVIYVVLYTANTFSSFFPPIAILSLSAGALFGPVWGTLALTLGVFCGTTAAFFTARYVGRSWIEKFVKGKGEKLYQQLSDNGFFVLLPMRLIGFPPYGIIDFICGLSKMRYFDFMAATMIASVPWVLAQVLLADRIALFAGQFVWNNPKTWFDPVLLGLITVFVLMIVITGKIVKKKQPKSNG
ncbi:MAG: TVP38/TMEM64 family protein [Candidatus Omnitrophica bacterium]|nr:TVP38/TMEM64 family protein [Candidatus Omnitrophota bacterium]